MVEFERLVGWLVGWVRMRHGDDASSEHGNQRRVIIIKIAQT